MKPKTRKSESRIPSPKRHSFAGKRGMTFAMRAEIKEMGDMSREDLHEAERKEGEGNDNLGRS